jgi:signal transduction histidine kinase
MKVIAEDTVMLQEEMKAAKLFIKLFYTFLFGYDICSYYLYPLYAKGERGIPKGGLEYWHYVALIALFPVALYMMSHGKTSWIKYMYVAVHTILDLTNILMMYMGTSKEFESGSVAEVFFVLFAPIFINKAYLLFVSVSMIGKYIVIGLILHTPIVTFPIMLLLIFSIVSFVILERFRSYTQTLTKTFQELHQAERLAVIGEMTAAITHEVRNPLTALKGFTQLQQEKHPDDTEYYAIMLKEIDRINGIVDDLLVLGNPKKSEFQKNSMAEIINHVIGMMTQQAKKQNVNIIVNISKRLPKVYCNDGQMKQVLINVIKNAIEAMQEGGNITITAKPDENSSVLIDIKDEGCGIDEPELEKLCRAFYTTKENGTGLGLMVTKRIIEEHRGQMQIYSEKGKGTTVRLLLREDILT